MCSQNALFPKKSASFDREILSQKNQYERETYLPQQNTEKYLVIQQKVGLQTQTSSVNFGCLQSSFLILRLYHFSNTITYVIIPLLDN